MVNSSSTHVSVVPDYPNKVIFVNNTRITSFTLNFSSVIQFYERCTFCSKCHIFFNGFPCQAVICRTEECTERILIVCIIFTCNFTAEYI